MSDTAPLTAGLFPDIAEDVYHADPCAEPSLSSGIAKLLLSHTPAHARLAHPRLNPDFAPLTRAAFDLGSAAHMMMLGDVDKLVVVDAADWRSKAARQARDDAHAAGKTPLLVHQAAEAAAMVAAGRAQLDAHPEAWEAFKPGYGRPEVTGVWQEDDVWCRMRLDWLPHAGTVYTDYKTTGGLAAPDEWLRTAINTGADVQAGLYCRGLRALTGKDARFRFVVQETAPPYALAVHELDPEWTHIAWAKADRAIRLWQWCLRTGQWPGYIGRVHTLECPPWEARRWEEAEARDALAGEAGDDLHEAMLRWQAPDAASAEAVAAKYGRSS